MPFSKEDLSFSKLNIRQKKLSDGVFVISPEGSIDSASEDEFRQKINDVLEKKALHLLIDMVQVKYLSSMGLGAIISLMHKTKELGASLALYDTQVPVKRVLQIARLDFLEIDPQKIITSGPFDDYVLGQEPQRQKLREAREAEKNKREEELAKRKKHGDTSRLTTTPSRE